MSSKDKMDDWIKHLRMHGFAIIPDILDKDECKSLIQEVGKFWEKRGVKLDDKSTWRDIYKYYPNHGMLFQHYVGHMQGIWNVRSNKNVVNVFDKIWGPGQKTVSFDGMSLGFKPEETNRGWHIKDWYHLDQSPNDSTFKCVQGWVSPLKVEEGDATLTVLKDSHLKHSDFCNHYDLKIKPEDSTKVKASKRANWYKLTQDQVEWYRDNGCETVNIVCPAGSMVVWDSRTVHAGRGALKNRQNPKNRIVVYVCMLPDTLTDAQRNKKIKAICENRTTTHWPVKSKLFAKHPRTYGGDLPPDIPFEPPLLTREGAKLAGFKGYSPFLEKDPEKRCIKIKELLKKIEYDKKKSTGKRIEEKLKRL